MGKHLDNEIMRQEREIDKNSKYNSNKFLDKLWNYCGGGLMGFALATLMTNENPISVNESVTSHRSRLAIETLEVLGRKYDDVLPDHAKPLAANLIEIWGQSARPNYAQNEHWSQDDKDYHSFFDNIEALYCKQPLGMELVEGDFRAPYGANVEIRRLTRKVK